MRHVKRSFTYANVVATLALFLALSGGVVLAASKIGHKQLAAKAVHANNIAKNAVTNKKVKKHSLHADRFAKTQLPGRSVVDASATNLPGVATDLSGGFSTGTPVPLTGTASFKPQKGKSYELLAEVQGNMVDADGPGAGTCFPTISINRSGQPADSTGAGSGGLAFLFPSANGAAPAGFQARNLDTTTQAVAVGDTNPVTLTAAVFGDPGCAGSTISSLHITVQELG
jgi:hypothetical protein